MAQIVEGVVARVDRAQGEIVIGTERFALLEGLPWSVDLTPGTAVTALVADRGDGRRLIHVQRYVDEWAAIRRRCGTA